MTTDPKTLLELAEEGIDEQAHSLTAISVAVRALLHGLANDQHPPGLETTLVLVAAETETAMERARLLLRAMDHRTGTPPAAQPRSVGIGEVLAAPVRSATRA